MTVYVQSIKDAISFLSTTVNSVTDLEAADATTRATVRRATQTLADAISSAVAVLDAQTAPGGLGGPPLGLVGAFPADTATALLASIANLDQIGPLLLAAGYVGRVQLNLGDVA